MGYTRFKARESWTATWTPGVNLANFYNLYDSKGNVTISTDTSISNALDGPIQVARYGAGIINAKLTLAQRGRGFIPLFDSLSMGAAGSISINALGAIGTREWAATKDICVPQSIIFTGKNTSYADFLAWIRKTGYCIFDPTLYACPPAGMGDVQCDWATWTAYGSALISAAGCGAGGARKRGGGANSGANGNNGVAGVNAPGGGGGGGWYSGGGGYTADGGQGGPAVPWSGGSPGLGSYEGFGTDGYLWGGPWIQSVRPGGVCFVFCRGNVTLTSGHLFSANGESASSTYMAGAGAGRIGLFYNGTLAGTFNGTASGGGFTSWASNGGAGVADIKTFAQMGWS